FPPVGRALFRGRHRQPPLPAAGSVSTHADEADRWNERYAPMNTLTLDHVSHRYERHALALQDVSLRLGPGVWGVVGPNGAGKTTLLRIVATLLAPAQGSIRWNGQYIVRQPQ